MYFVFFERESLEFAVNILILEQTGGIEPLINYAGNVIPTPGRPICIICLVPHEGFEPSKTYGLNVVAVPICICQRGILFGELSRDRTVSISGLEADAPPLMRRVLKLVPR